MSHSYEYALLGPLEDHSSESLSRPLHHVAIQFEYNNPPPIDDNLKKQAKKEKKKYEKDRKYTNVQINCSLKSTKLAYNATIHDQLGVRGFVEVGRGSYGVVGRVASTDQGDPNEYALK